MKTYRLEVIKWDDINAKKYGGDIFLNTYVEKFFTLDDAWKYLGFKLKRERCGYSGMRNNTEYRLIREA